MEENELNFKTDIVIPEAFYNECLSTEYNDNDLDQLIKLINESDPLNQLKGLTGLSKLYKINNTKSEPNLLYDDVEKLFNFLENFPLEFKIGSLICLASIENYNLNNENLIIHEPNDKIIKIILYILDFPNKYKLELLKSNLDYLGLLVYDKDIINKFDPENLYQKVRNLFEKVDSNEIEIIKKIIGIMSKIFEKEEEIAKNENIVIELIPFLNDLMVKYETNKDILNFSLNIIFFITNVNVNAISNIESKVMDKIIELNLLKKLIDKIDTLNPEDDKTEIFNSLKIIANFGAMENSYYTDKIIELNVLDKLKLLMQDKYSLGIRKETAWLISNIAAGTINQLTKLYENNFQDILFDNISNSPDDKIRNNCLWALYNFSSLKNIEYLNALIEKGFIDIIIKRLKIDKGDTLACSLEALNNILCQGKNLDPAVYNIIETKVNELDNLNELKNFLKNNHSNTMIKNKIQTIFNNYFGIDNIEQFLNENNEPIYNIS